MNKPNIILSLAIALLFAACGNKQTDNKTEDVQTSKSPDKTKSDVIVISAQSEPDTLKGSLPAQADGKVGGTEIKISYHSPAVRGRIVWGGLVPYDKVWVTGAHMATSIEFNQTLLIGGKEIPAGTYALFTIPGKDEWTVIINHNWKQHLTDKYDPKDDLVRVKVRPEVEENNQERLRYVVEADDNSEGEIVVYWEKLEISLPVKSTH